jgi:hypothetical protein
VAQAVKGSSGEKEEDAEAAAALPHAVAPVGAPSVYCCGGERSVYCCGGAEEPKGGDGEEEKDGGAAAALPHAVAPVGAPSMYSCGDAEERKGCGGDTASASAHAVAPAGAPSAAAALHGEWRDYSKSCCCTEQRRFRKYKVTWRALRSTTGVSQRNRDLRSLSPESSFKTEGVSTSKLSSFTRTSRRITLKKVE